MERRVQYRYGYVSPYRIIWSHRLADDESIPTLLLNVLYAWTIRTHTSSDNHSKVNILKNMKHFVLKIYSNICALFFVSNSFIFQSLAILLFSSLLFFSLLIFELVRTLLLRFRSWYIVCKYMFLWCRTFICSLYDIKFTDNF